MAMNFGSGKRDRVLSASGGRISPEHTPLQELFLDRLTYLVRKINLHRCYLVPSDRRMLLLNRAILSTFCDCREMGVEGEARAILARLRREVELPEKSPDTPLF